MKVLLLGNGAREHALALRFAKSPSISGLYVAPGNGGTADIARNLPDVNPEDPEQVLSVCQEKGIDLVFVGPEGPLAAGVVDALKAENILAVGPDKHAAQLESSKAFSKDFMIRNAVPTADSRKFSNLEDVKRFLKNPPYRPVLKKSGLAAGKGVLESEVLEEQITFAEQVLKDDQLVIEQFLEGYEISVFALTDGNSYKLLPVCADYKKAGEEDTGLNTGGMGAICPVPTVPSELIKRVEKEVVIPTFNGFKKDNLRFSGIVYFGLMITQDGPRVLEYNIRFGDPEAQVLLPKIKGDFCSLARAMADGTLDEFDLQLDDRFALGVVVASSGYPGPYKKGVLVENLPPKGECTWIFQASTRKKEGALYTGGGRCFTAVALDDSFLKARTKAYKVAEKIRFDGSWFRKDIGEKFILK